LRLQNGVTESEFINQLKLSVPVEDGFLSEPESVVNAVILFNFTLMKYLYTIHTVHCIKGQMHYDPRPFDIMALDSAEGSHFVVHRRLYTLHIHSTGVNQNNKTIQFTSAGYKLDDLDGKIISILGYDGERFQTTETAGSLFGTVKILNKSQFTIIVEVDRPITAYNIDPTENERLKRRREPDMGPKAFKRKVIETGGEWILKVPQIQFVVLVHETTAESNGNPLYLAVYDQDYVYTPNDDIVINEIETMPGSYVSHLKGKTPVDRKVLRSDRSEQIKMLNSNLVFGRNEDTRTPSTG